MKGFVDFSLQLVTLIMRQEKKLYRTVLAFVMIAAFIVADLPFGILSPNAAGRIYACNYSERTDTLYCDSDKGCDDELLSSCSRVIVDTYLTKEGIKLLRENKNIKSIYVASMKNFSVEDAMALGKYITKEREAGSTSYSSRTDTLYSDATDGCSDERLEYAANVIVDTYLTQEGIDLLKKNDRLVSLEVNDLSNFTDKDLSILYYPLVKGDIALAGVLFSYSNYNDSFGNDGTDLYKKVLANKCPNIKTYRSCATTVSAAIRAADCGTCSYEGTAGLVNYFEASNDWINLGPLGADYLRSGDIIFIDRKSHAQQYISGEMTDSEQEAEEEYVYKGGYDSTGHKNYETQDPTGVEEEVFNPDQDGDGRINDWEAEYWKCYWERANAGTDLEGYVPYYEYYYVWKDKADKKKKEKEAKEKEKKEKKEQKKQQQVVVNPTGRVIHDHIFVWTGNDVIRKRFPNSEGNIVSGSYTERYANARSSAVSKYNFTGDYRVYRYGKNIRRSVSVNGVQFADFDYVTPLDGIQTFDGLPVLVTPEELEKAEAAKEAQIKAAQEASKNSESVPEARVKDENSEPDLLEKWGLRPKQDSFSDWLDSFAGYDEPSFYDEILKGYN